MSVKEIKAEVVYVTLGGKDISIGAKDINGDGVVFTYDRKKFVKYLDGAIRGEDDKSI